MNKREAIERIEQLEREVQSLRSALAGALKANRRLSDAVTNAASGRPLGLFEGSGGIPLPKTQAE